MEIITFKILKKLCSTSRQEMENAFDIIFNKYRYLVYFVSFDIVKNEEDAKDIVNETFLKMYERRTYFSKESNLKYYLLVTAKNLSLNKIKEDNDHLSYSDDISGYEDNDHASLYLDKFKDILDKEEYDYLILHVIYEFTFREIAKYYKVTTSVVSSKYQRGIKKLQAYYGGKKDE